MREPPHLTPSELSRLTDTERRVAALRQKAVAMQCVRAPSKRSTRIVLFDPQLENHSNQNTFSEAEANGGAISIGSSGADDDEDMDNDPQVMRMRMEQLQRKIAESNEEKVSVYVFHELSCGVVFAHASYFISTSSTILSRFRYCSMHTPPATNYMRPWFFLLPFHRVNAQYSRATTQLPAVMLFTILLLC